MARTSLPVTLGVGTALVLSLTGPAAQAVPAAAAPAVAAQSARTSHLDAITARSTVIEDTFWLGRFNGWGKAPTGGAWTTWGNAFGNGIRGVLEHAPSTGAGARVDSVRVRDQITEVAVTVSERPSADLHVTLGQRETKEGRYETRLVFRTDGTVDMQLVAKTSAGQRVLASTPRGSFRSWAGKDIYVRTATLGEGTTTLAASIWEQGSPAPTSWTLQATDSSPALQGEGTVGLETWYGRGSKPVRLMVNNWVTEKVELAATADQTAPAHDLQEVTTPAPKPSPTTAPPPAPAPAPEPAPSPTAAPTAAPAPTQTPAPEPAPAPAPEPTSGTGTSLESLGSSGDLARVPVSSIGAGAMPLGATSYPVPADAIHVKAGADARVGNGREATPFASIQKAVHNAKPGATIVVHEGVYHEYIGVFNDPKWNTNHDRTTIQAAPGATVWLDGSKALTSWTRSGATWTTPWTDDKNFNTVAGFGSRDETGDLAFAGSQNPLAADSSQVFIDGRQLQQVAANPGKGQFAVDRRDPANKKIVLGEDPSGREVRASSLHQAIVSNVNDLVLRGIGVRGYATPLNWMGTVYINGQRPTVENMVFDSLPTVPLNLSGSTGAVVRSNTSVFAGLNGFGAHRADDSTFANNYVYGANQQHFNAAPVAAGVKVTQMQDMEFTGNEIVGTTGATGLWVDESVVNFSITDNRIADNGSLGVHVEISACAIVAGNEIVNNRGSGIEVLGTPHTWITNNYIAGNGASGSANISVLQDARRQANGGMGIDPRHPEPDPINTWITTEVRIVNNILGAPHANSRGQFDVHDRAGKSYADLMLAQVEGNVLVDRTTQNFARLGTPNHTSKEYPDLASVRAAHPQDWRTNTVVTGGSRAELEKLAARTKGVPLDAAIASVLGLPTGTTMIGMP